MPIPVDAGGMRVDALAALASNERVRAVYLTPHHQYPTTAVLAPGRRMALLELARARRIAIVEDDYDHEFHYEGRPVLPLASADRAGVVVYIGTLSKILAPGLRIGYVVAPRALVEALAARRAYVDRQGDQVGECAVAELLEDGEVQRHARRARTAYARRRDVLAAELRSSFGDALAFELPAGGTAIWARVHSSIDVEAWAAAAAARGIGIQTARAFAFDGRARPYVRVGFALHTEAELRSAVAKLCDALTCSRAARTSPCRSR
jgi:GntR family transcriptional regulator/MocR family aminotransferase